MRDDGGPAFPIRAHGPAMRGDCDGMTLRQWYAGLAMQALSGPAFIWMKGSKTDKVMSKRALLVAKEIPQVAFHLADTMIAEDREVHDDSK